MKGSYFLGQNNVKTGAGTKGNSKTNYRAIQRYCLIWMPKNIFYEQTIFLFLLFYNIKPKNFITLRIQKRILRFYTNFLVYKKYVKTLIMGLAEETDNNIDNRKCNVSILSYLALAHESIL